MKTDAKITMSIKEVNIMQACIGVSHRITTKRAAAKKVGMTERHFYRCYDKWVEGGEHALTHKSRGAQGNHRYSKDMRARILTIVETELSGHTPVHAAEILKKEYNITIHPNTLRTWMKQHGTIPVRTYKPRKHRTRRERSKYRGELIQVDGSFHRWFGSTMPSCCLIAMIDDATNQIYAQFAEQEYASSVVTVLSEWISCHGIPMKLYFDLRNAYVPSKKKGDTEERVYIPAVCERLGIQIINAHSPQAKGRVERLFRTLQDRLRAELQRHGITSIAEGNLFLKQYYCQVYNEQFASAPILPEDAHVSVHPGYDMDKVYGMHHTRTVTNDWTIRYDGRLFQIPRTPAGPPYPRTKITCIVFLDGSVHAYYHNSEIPIREVSRAV